MIKIKINYSKSYGDFHLKVSKYVNLPFAPFYGLEYFDTTNGQEIRCKMSDGHHQRCTIYIYGEETIVDINETIHQNSDVQYLKDWLQSVQKAGFHVITNDIDTIGKFLALSK